MSYHNHHNGSPCPCKGEYAHTSGCGKSRPFGGLGALLIPAEVSTNPAATTPAPTSYTTYAVVAGLGLAGYLLYRHFKKPGSSTPSEGT